MWKLLLLCGACLTLRVAHAQSVDSVTSKVLSFPSRLFDRIQSKTASLNDQLTKQTQKYLDKMARAEARMQKKLSGVDSAGAQRLFAGSAQQYAALIQKLKTDTGSPHQRLSGVYQPYTDSLQSELAFLKLNPQLLNGVNPAALQGSISQLQTVQSKLQVADQAKAFIQQRQQQITQYLSQHSTLQGLESKFTSGISQDAYYYSQQVDQYREMLSDPGKMEQKALSMVSGLPTYQNFVKANGQLAGMFKLPGGVSSEGNSAQPLPGLQTHSEIASQVQNQVSSVASGGAGGAMGQIQSKVQAAQGQLDSYKSKLSQLGGGSTLAAAPNFRPNDQKTKTFWRRLEYGVNFQTTTSTYYFPTTTDFGASLGYQLGHSNLVGIGASYNMGWGSSIQHISITDQGVGLRSFLQIAIKNGFSATGGVEYNYTTQFTNLQQLRQIENWTRSGLIGLSKIFSMKNRVFKKAQVQLLWDFLSYQQVPKTQPLLFRIGYTL